MKKFLAVLATSIALVGAMLTGVAPAQASWEVTSYSYHYDNHCHDIWVVYAGEPQTRGYVVRWWYKTYETRRYYSTFEQLRYGVKYTTLKRWTVFSHRDYPKRIWCTGVW